LREELEIKRTGRLVADKVESVGLVHISSVECPTLGTANCCWFLDVDAS
jgi:hypothetical protein